MDFVNRRILKDIELLNKNKSELQKRGIYYHVNDTDITHLKVLVIPRPKNEGTLYSPYTYGNFLFSIKFENDYPLSPPKVTFHPQQNFCRLHPNYYQNGKVCLSVINTWAGNDWTPSTSLLSLINILEERFNENAVCFEPGRENTSPASKHLYNIAVEYAKYYITILTIDTYQEFSDFKEVIQQELIANMPFLMDRAKHLKVCVGKRTISDTYTNQFEINYDYIINKFHLKYPDILSRKD